MSVSTVGRTPHISTAAPATPANPAAPAAAANNSSTIAPAAPAAQSPGFFAQIKNAIFKCLSYLPFIGSWFAETTVAPTPATTPSVLDDTRKLDDIIKPAFATAAPNADTVATAVTAFETFTTLEGKLKAVQFLVDCPHANADVVKQFYARLPLAEQHKLDGLTWEKSHVDATQRHAGLKFETDPKSAHAKAAVAALLAQAQALTDAQSKTVILTNYNNAVNADVQAAALSLFAGMTSRVQQLQTIDGLMKSQHTTPALVKDFINFDAAS